MNKLKALFILLLALAFCTCTIPSSVEIKGTASLSFSANMDISEMFTEMMRDIFEDNEDVDSKVITCTYEDFEYQTYVVHTYLLNENIGIAIDGDPGNITSIIIDGEEYFLEKEGDSYKSNIDIKIKETGEKPIKLPIANITEVLDGFCIKEAAVFPMLYLSGDPIIERCTVTLYLGESKEELNVSINNPEYIYEFLSSGINLNLDEYASNILPVHGRRVPPVARLINENKDTIIGYKIVLDSGKLFTFEEIDSPKATLELVMMIALQLEPDGSTDEPRIKFSDLSEASDFFSELPDFVKSIGAKIKLNVNPFSKGRLVVQDVKDGNNILLANNPMGEQTLEFYFNEYAMAHITGNDIEPNFSIIFGSDDDVNIYKDVRLMEIDMEAKFSIEQEF